MAVIKGIDFTTVFTDVQSAMLNAFAQVGDTWYFGYINTNNDAVVYQSGNLGVDWTLYNNYGPWDFVAVTATYDASEVVITLTGAQYNQTLVYKGGVLAMEADGSVASNGAVCLWPYLAMMQGSTENTTIGYPQSGTTVGFMQTVPIRAVVGYMSGGQGIDIVGSASYDIGPGWSGESAPYVYSAFGYHPQDPNDPHSASVLGATSSEYSNWVGLNSRTYSGFISYTDFAGFSTGGVTDYVVPDNRTQYKRGTYFDGYSASGTFVIADRGLNGPHQTVTGSTVDGILCALWVDSGGLIGTTIDDESQTYTDSSGTASPFDKAKIYGSQTNITWSPNSYAPAIQSTSMTAFLLGRSGTSGPYTLYRISDPNVLDRPRAANTELISHTTTITQNLPSIRNPYDINDQSNALGTARAEATTPAYGIDFLVDACTDTAILPNPNGSPGCSPILRELLNESGVAYSVVREVANDGDLNGHQGGNALDLAGPDSPTVLVGESVTAEAYQQMGEICAFLTQVPELFACVIHLDPISSDNSLFIWDGKIVTSDQFGGDKAQAVQDSISNIHISSSKTRLLRGFKNPKVVAALGLSTPYTDPITGATTSQNDVDPFTADRYVYVNSDGYVGSEVTGLAAEKQPAYIVNFW